MVQPYPVCSQGTVATPLTFLAFSSSVNCRTHQGLLPTPISANKDKLDPESDRCREIAVEGVDAGLVFLFMETERLYDSALKVTA